MRILFLSHYFPPEVNAPASRTFDHCRAWAKAGHEVTVVTCAPNHPRGIVYEGYRNRLCQEERRDGIRIIRLWTFVTANEGIVRRTLGYLSFMVSCVIAAPFLPATDIVLTTSPQFFNGLAGYPVSRLKRCRWALEIRDLWPESIVVVGSLRNRTLIRWLDRMEMFAYRKADAIVPVTDSFKRYMLERGIDAAKIEVIKNGADLSFFRPFAGGNPLRSQLGLGGKFVVAYFGTHGLAHGLGTVLDAAELLRSRRDIVFLLVGDGAQRQPLLRQRDARGLANVVMLDQQPKTSMPMLWDLASVSLVHLKKSPLFRTVIPSKIFESMAMERPVLLGVEGESADIIRAGNAGICFEPGNASALADCVIELAAQPDRVREMGLRARTFVAEQFDRNRLADRYAVLLKQVVSRCRTSA